MPLYEYKCQSCGNKFEVLQKFSDAPVTVHAECGGGPVEKLLSSPSFHFKGTGWYVTDYAKGNGTSPPTEGKSEKSDKAAAKSESSDKSSDSKNSDSKPAESKTAETKTAATPAASASTSDSK